MRTPLHSQHGNVKEQTVDEAIESVGFGKFQFIALFAAGFCFMADSMEVGLLAFLSIVLKHEWGLTSAQAATMTALVFVGEFIGTLSIGRLGDIYGRRPMFLAAGTIICVAGSTTALAQNFSQVCVIQFFVGVGIGGLTVPFDIFAEFLPSSRRGRYLMYINYFWGMGSISVIILAYITLGFGYSWRWFVLLNAIPSFISVVMCYIFIPESPRWLMTKNQIDESIAILRKVAKINGKNPDEYFNVDHGYSLRNDVIESSRFSDLFTPKWRKITLLLWGLWFGFGFSYNGLCLAIPRVFDSSDDGSGTFDEDESPSFNFQALAVSAAAEMIGTLISALVVDSFGRIGPQVVGFALSGFLVFFLLWFAHSSPVWLLTILALGARTFEVGASSLSWVITAEVLPTELRSTGHSTANAVCRLGAILTSYAVEGGTSLASIAIIMVFVHVFTIFCVSQLPETKGRALGQHGSDAIVENDLQNDSGDTLNLPLLS